MSIPANKLRDVDVIPKSQAGKAEQGCLSGIRDNSHCDHNAVNSREKFVDLREASLRAGSKCSVIPSSKCGLLGRIRVQTRSITVPETSLQRQRWLPVPLNVNRLPLNVTLTR